MFKSDYTQRLLEKENQRLLRENEHLRKQVTELDDLKEKYQDLIAELKEYRNKYKDALNSIHTFESEMRKEFHKLLIKESDEAEKIENKDR